MDLSVRPSAIEGVQQNARVPQQQTVDGANHQILIVDPGIAPPVSSERQESTLVLNNQNLTVFDNAITQEASANTEENLPEENEEETQESFAMVEQALSGVGLKEAKGFALKYECLPCCPTLSVNPTLECYPFSGLTVRSRGWELIGSPSPKCGCFCCFMPRKWNWQTITLRHNEREVLNFIYRPNIWWFQGSKERVVDIYIPERNKRIGWIKYSKKVGNGAVVADCVTRSLFVMKKIETGFGSDTLAMQVTTNFGIPVAIAQATRGLRYRGMVTWKEFEMKLSDVMSGNLSSSSTKSAMLVAFAMWVLTYREDTLRWRMVWCIAVPILVLIVFLVLTLTLN